MYRKRPPAANRPCVGRTKAGSQKNALTGSSAVLQSRTMRKPQFTIRGMMIMMAAIALLLSEWPPYRFEEGPLHQSPGFNTFFWRLAGFEAFLFGLYQLVKFADSQRMSASDSSE
jgi:hypothetical protein